VSDPKQYGGRIWGRADVREVLQHMLNVIPEHMQEDVGTFNILIRYCPEDTEVVQYVDAMVGAEQTVWKITRKDDV
jgi:hypothetical protein